MSRAVLELFAGECENLGVNQKFAVDDCFEVVVLKVFSEVENLIADDLDHFLGSEVRDRLAAQGQMLEAILNSASAAVVQ